MKQLNVKIITPAGVVFENQAEFVVVKTDRGEMGILPDHSDTMLVLANSVVRVGNDASLNLINLPYGALARVFKNTVEIICMEADNVKNKAD